MSDYDFNNADTLPDIIPGGETMRIRLAVLHGDAGPDNILHRSKTSEALMLLLEATVLDGKYARRKFWPRFYMGAASGEMTESQKVALGISQSMLRAIVEASRGVSPTDESPAAVKARRLASLSELDGMECAVVTGVERGKNGYRDRTIISHVADAQGAAKSAAF